MTTTTIARSDTSLAGIATAWHAAIGAWEAQTIRDTHRRHPSGRRAAALATRLERLEAAALAAPMTGPDDLEALAAMTRRRLDLDGGSTGAGDTDRLLNRLLGALLRQ